jgi:hypothetical protein
LLVVVQVQVVLVELVLVVVVQAVTEPLQDHL